MKRTAITIGLLAFGLIVAISAVAFAHGGGYGRHMGEYGGHMMGPGYGGGYGGGPMMGYGPGYGRHMRGNGGWGSLSEEDAAKIDAAREAFYKDTRELRDQIYDARGALRNEMEKDQPSEDQVVKLQKKVSQLQAKFDEKAVAHKLEMNKLMPEDYQSRGFRRGYCW